MNDLERLVEAIEHCTRIEGLDKVLGIYSASTDSDKQVTTWHCNGCDGEGSERWPEWKVSFDHKPGCKYLFIKSFMKTPTPDQVQNDD